MDSQPRLLLIGPQPERLDGAIAAAEVDRVPPEPAEVARRLDAGGYTAVLATPEVTVDLLERFHRDELIVGNLDHGLAVLDAGGTVTWVNDAFRHSGCGVENPVGMPLLAALGAELLDDEVGEPAPTDPLEPARRGRPVTLRLHCPNSIESPYLEADIRPVLGPDGAASRMIAVVQNITAEVNQQQKLDALHIAGRELAGLDPELLSDMNIPSRVELLKHNLRRVIHDILHYDTIEVRVLDRRTSELKPLLEDGMTPQAASRVLFARPNDNGVTGHVAFTGKSYLCPDTEADPLYIRGAEGTRSSMTVPLIFQDEVIGTLNVESPRPNGFGPDDLQFTELFSREVADALHTLDLLSAQQECTASQSIDAINREIAIPIDEVLASASVLIGKPFADPETTALLRKILDNVRLVKESVSMVGRTLTPRQAEALPDGHPLTGGRGSARPMIVAADQPDGTAPASTDEEAPLVGRRVLIVDPDERMRRQAHLLLTRLGATVESAGTASAGLAMAADNQYDAIFLDVKPPDMGGYECYRRFKAARPGTTLALTTGFGYDLAHSIVKARQDGLRYVLFKPFRQDQVVTAVLDQAAAPVSA